MTCFANNAKLAAALLKSGSVFALVLSQAAVAQTAPTADPAPSAAPIKAFSGDINPFGGDINPFTGDINPFGGDINPFQGDLNPFGGDINPFTGDINPFGGDINPFTGHIDPFAGDINPFWGTIDPAKRVLDANAPAWMAVGGYWGTATQSWKSISQQASDFRSTNLLASTRLSTDLTAFVTNANLTWGRAVTARTGKTFQAGFVDPLLAKFGLTALTANSVAGLSPNQRNAFFLEWYDGLMAYSGADRVDWWMSAVKWSPAITQQQGSGVHTIIGLLDADMSSNYDVSNNVIWSGGVSSASVNGHGAGVASLMVAAHNGKGVMGIAPRASVVAYNPFDATNSASWADIQTGIDALRANGASIINASLGVPGWTLPQEWRGVMTTTQATGSNPVYVIAAGNTGTTQTQNLNWDFAKDPGFLVVGSVGATKEISSFSNRPGTTCLLKSGRCTGDYLMNHFIVAPGELILMSNGTSNGTTRASGTSFAAPLVSGAIALLHDRWPWLAQHPDETVKIIVDTATDLGAPGVDPVYGVGMLNIVASQSPISFNNLTFKQIKNGVATDVTAPSLLANGIQSNWDADGVYFTLFETVGDTYRDFQVPVSSRLTGLVQTLAGRQNFQKFITSRFTDWVSGKSGFTDLNSFGVTAADGTRVNFASSALEQTANGRNLMEHSSVTVDLPGNRFAVTAGNGYGALVNGAQPGFARSADYDAATGGANPLLGFASGGAFAQAEARIGKGTVSFGFTENRIDLRDSEQLDHRTKMQLFSISPYSANAVNLHVTQPVGERLTLAFDYARVREANAILGVQSTVGSDFLGGSTTDAYTVGAQLDIGGGFALAATATQGRTRTDRDQALVSDGAIGSSAYSMSIHKHAVAVRGDLLAVTLSQPLRVHSSTLSLTELRVTDRLTGKMGDATQSFGIGGERAQVSGELQYGAPFADGQGRIGLYGKGDLQAAGGRAKEFVVGGQMSVRF